MLWRMLRLVALSSLFILFFLISTLPRSHQSPTPEAPLPPQSIVQEELIIATTSTEDTLNKDSTPQEEPELEPEKQVTPPPLVPTELIRAKAQSAVVNILCEPEKNGTIAVSGTGVMIDPRGVILTNAHVAQYVLISGRDEINLSCTVRSGSPATNSWGVELLYIPPEWVAEHAEDILKTSPTGTGEHDYALLIAKDGAKPLGSPPFTLIETTITPSIMDKTVVLAAYPAEFSGFAATQQFLLSSVIVTPVKSVLTFDENIVDVLSFGAVALAQGGSSGGAVVNEDGYLIAIISTTSNKEFIAERDLRGITLSYINRALAESSGTSLKGLLAGDVVAQGAQFRANQAPALAQQIINYLVRR